MSDVLRDLVGRRESRAKCAEARAGRPSTVSSVLRLAAIVALAATAYRYHGRIFAAGQPIVNRIYRAAQYR